MGDVPSSRASPGGVIYRLRRYAGRYAGYAESGIPPWPTRGSTRRPRRTTIRPDDRACGAHQVGHRPTHCFSHPSRTCSATRSSLRSRRGSSRRSRQSRSRAGTTPSRCWTSQRSSPPSFPTSRCAAWPPASWAQMYRGELDEALTLLKTAKQVAHRPGFSDLDRAEVLFRIGCVRVKRGANSRAVNDLSLALELCERSGRPCDRLRAEILQWRSRSYQHQRDFDAAAHRRRACARARRGARRHPRRRPRQLPPLRHQRARRRLAARALLRREGEGPVRAVRRPARTSARS